MPESRNLSIFSNKVRPNRYLVGGDRADEIVTISLSRGELRVAGFALEDLAGWLEEVPSQSREMRTGLQRQASRLKKLAGSIAEAAERQNDSEGCQ